MASPRSGSSSHDTTDSLPYGFGKGTKDAFNAFLQGRDPKQAKANQKNSSGGRARRNIISALPDIDILEELLRRQRVERKRKNGRERQQRHREKLAMARAKE